MKDLNKKCKSHTATISDLLYPDVPVGIISQHWQRVVHVPTGLPLTKRPVISTAQNDCCGWIYGHLAAPAPSKEPWGLKGWLWLRLRHYRRTRSHLGMSMQTDAQQTHTWGKNMQLKTLKRAQTSTPSPTGGLWVLPKSLRQPQQVLACYHGEKLKHIQTLIYTKCLKSTAWNLPNKSKKLIVADH